MVHFQQGSFTDEHFQEAAFLGASGIFNKGGQLFGIGDLDISASTSPFMTGHSWGEAVWRTHSFLDMDYVQWAKDISFVLHCFLGGVGLGRLLLLISGIWDGAFRLYMERFTSRAFSGWVAFGSFEIRATGSCRSDWVEKSGFLCCVEILVWVQAPVTKYIIT